MKKATKIVRVIARLNVGGPARHVVWLTEGLQAPAYQSILVAGTVPPEEDDMGYFATEMGVAPIFLEEMSREISPKDVLTIWKLYKLLLRERPDIVHTHTAKAGTVGRLAGLLYRWLTPATLIGRPRPCRFVHTYHGHIFHSYYGRVKTRLFLMVEKTLARIGTDRIVVISKQQRHEIHDIFGVGRAHQFAVVPLGLDIKHFAEWQTRGHELRDQLALKQNDILVGIVGRLAEVKNHQLFLEAVAHWKKSFSHNLSDARVHFVLIGDGQLKNTLSEQTEALGLTESVTFLGTRRDLENVYPALDIVALTSRNEGTPLTLIEAMANARPVISTAVGGVIDLLGAAIPTGEDNGKENGKANGKKRTFVVCERGISVPSGDAAAFAEGLDHLMTDPALRREIGERGLQFIAANYSRERLLDDVKLLYADLLKQN